MNERNKIAKPAAVARGPVLPVRNSGYASLPADRSFKVLQPSRTPAQLSLFPPGLAARSGR